ncbi:MAG: hypothetical protein KDI09_04025 [Halioglobus sp.]|nr:hypothetical protein [Halioglobus sp.]
MTATIDREFAEKMLQTFDNPQEHGVHLLFNEWWRYAPQEVTQSYLKQFCALEHAQGFLNKRFYADPLDLDALGRFRDGTLGHSYYHFILDNHLEEKIAMNYRQLHEHMDNSGQLDSMPEEFKYTILRGFQIHDFLHVLTGYDSSPFGEVALQAFTLAQKRFPYMSMWMSTLTTRMTYLEPETIGPVMDAITDGWQFGRKVGNIVFLEYETMLDRPLVDLRREYGIDPTGSVPLAA